jgi:hypothetical protein
MMTEAIAALGGRIQIPAASAAELTLHSLAAHDDTAGESSVIEMIGGGRSAVGDRRPSARPRFPAVSIAPVQVVPEPVKMGCSGYRIKHGTSDEAIVKAIREHAAKSVAETDNSPWLTAASLTDEQLLAVIGWSFLAKTACAMVAQHLSEMSG